jgi:hypothetical protein
MCRYLLLPLNVGTVCQYQYDVLLDPVSDCMRSNGAIAFSVALLRDTSGSKFRRPESWRGFSFDALW